MIENSDTFQLLVEIAIAVAGFAGVATVFGGQNRSYQAAENLRLRALFQNSALVLVGCMSLLALDAADVEHRWNVAAVSLLVISFYLVTFLDVPLKSIKLRSSNDSSVTVFSLSIAVFHRCTTDVGQRPAFTAGMATCYRVFSLYIGVFMGVLQTPYEPQLNRSPNKASQRDWSTACPSPCWRRYV